MNAEPVGGSEATLTGIAGQPVETILLADALTLTVDDQYGFFGGLSAVARKNILLSQKR